MARTPFPFLFRTFLPLPSPPRFFVPVLQARKQTSVNSLPNSISCLRSQIFRKAALKIVQGVEGAVEVTTDNLQEYVGKPLFNTDKIYDQTPPGVVMGLAWTSLGR